MKRLAVAFVISSILIGGGIGIAGTHSHKLSPEMRKQHHAMAAINKQWNILRRAFKSGDLKTAGRATEKILETAPALDDFKLHKNADKRAQFVEYRNAFVKNMTGLRDAIKAHDLDAARALPTTVQDTCNRCHEMFR